MIVAHADWGAAPAKQWVAIARARSDGRWEAFGPINVKGHGTLRDRLHVEPGPAILGFDFPIGVPRAWAALAGVDRFPELLQELGGGAWGEFFDVADRPEEISLRRPFFPRTASVKGEKKQAHLTAGLGLELDALRRRCEFATTGRRAACALFWTCGGNQVGKGALSGWRLLQAEPSERLAYWPFDGRIDELCGGDGSVVVETYPAEFCLHLGLGRVVGKRRQEVRRSHADGLLAASRSLGVVLDAPLEQHIRDGFGVSAAGEDQFDAAIGLLGMLNVVRGHRSPGDPLADAAVQHVEGWILGQQAA